MNIYGKITIISTKIHYILYNKGIGIMIYSNDINKVCSLCVFAQAIDGNDDEIYCQRYKKNTAATMGDCKKFKYDIFKKVVRRKRRLNTNFTADDFKL